MMVALKTLFSLRDRENFLKKLNSNLLKKPNFDEWNERPAASKLGIFFLFLNLFLWFLTLIISNNISTNKVVVDTSILIQTAEEGFEKTKLNNNLN